MKKIIISISILVIAVFLGMFMYHKMTYQKTNYEYIKFNQIPNIVEENEKVIIFVKQDGCSPCKLVEPIVNDYAKGDKGIVYTIIGNKDKDYASQSQKYHIEGTPTLIFYRNGKEVQRMNTAFTDSEFQQMIKKVDF